MSASGPHQILSEKLKKRFADNAFRTLRPADFEKADFSSNDYLGFSRSVELYDRFRIECSRIPGDNERRTMGAGGSRLLAGDSRYAHETEDFISDYFRSEASLIFNSGYTANLALFSALPTRKGTVLYDDYIHASVRDGIRMSGCKAWSFRHNDLAHLEELLKKSGPEIWVVAEAIYSMDGDSPDLVALVALCEKYNAALIIDEAHSGGVIGEQGRGMCVSAGLHERIFARLYTFGKAFGVHGAAVCGDRTLINYLINFARPFIYSTALPLHDLAAIKSSLELCALSDTLRSELSALTEYFRKHAIAHNLSGMLINSVTPVQGMIIPGNDVVRRVAEVCQTHAIDVRPVLSPTVKPGAERLRIIIHAFNTRREIDSLLNVVKGAIVDKS